MTTAFARQVTQTTSTSSSVRKPNFFCNSLRIRCFYPVPQLCVGFLFFCCTLPSDVRRRTSAVRPPVALSRTTLHMLCTHTHTQLFDMCVYNTHTHTALSHTTLSCTHNSCTHTQSIAGYSFTYNIVKQNSFTRTQQCHTHTHTPNSFT